MASAASARSTKSQCGKLVVAAIDFGTTYSGYAFSFKHEYEKDPTKVASNNWTAGTRALVSLKTPTTLLLKEDGSFEAFGYEAEDRYSELALDEEHEKYFYFRRFKMALFNKSMASGLKRDMMIEDELGKKKKAIVVFSMSIKYLKEHVMNTITNRAVDIKESDVQWVLTVPAIWSDGSKQFMREAAEIAGMKTDSLIIALEPEAASLWCMHVPVDKMEDTVKKDSQICTFSRGTRYMVVDVGGGTVDITVHEVVDNGVLKELNWASGGAWGGTRVDEAFKDLIIRIIGTQAFKKFCIDQTADLIDFYREFETKKRNINLDKKEGKETLKLPVALADVYKDVTKKDIKTAVAQCTDLKDKITWAGDKLRISRDTFQALFEDTCANTIKHIKDILSQDASKGTRTILLVGGFSESPLLQAALKQAFPDKRLIIPEEAGLAVLKGAVLFGHNPLTIQSRIAKCSYGIRVYRDFDSSVHPPGKKIVVNGRAKCKDVFAVHVKKGQELVVGEPQVKQRYTPLEADQLSLVFDVYTSTEENPMYVTDFSCSYIGQLEVDVPDLSGGKERGIWVSMIFGGTEVHVEASNEKTKAVTRAKFDFLQ